MTTRCDPTSFRLLNDRDSFDRGDGDGDDEWEWSGWSDDDNDNNNNNNNDINDGEIVVNWGTWVVTIANEKEDNNHNGYAKEQVS